MSLRRELARKLLHVSTATVPIAYAAGLPREVVVLALAALVVVALLVELARRSDAGAAAFARVTGTLLREHEHAGAWAGATWLLLAFLVATLAFPRAVAIAAMLGVSLGDAAGAVVGRWWGERRRARASMRVTATGTMANAATVAPARVPVSAGVPPRAHDTADAVADHHPDRAPIIAHAAARDVGIAPAAKTWAGTIACAAITSIAALAIARLGAGESVLAGVLAAAAERPVSRLDDNMRIVCVVGGGILLCRLAFS